MKRRPSGALGGKRASVALLGAAAISMLTAMAAVGVDLGAAYQAKAVNQRIADSAAYAGALGYNATGSTGTMTAAASSLAVLNGLSASAATASLTASPSGNGNSAVKVTVTTQAPLHMARIFVNDPGLAVSATAYAEVKPAAAGCVYALKAGSTGIVLSGGTVLTASSCTVASNATVAVPCGTTIVTKTLNYNAVAAPSQPCGGIQPPAGTASVSIVKTATADPFAADSGIAAAFSHLTAVASLTGPAGPVVASGTTLTFGYSVSPTQSQLTTIGCAGSFASPVWTVTCPSGGTYAFGGISLAGGITLNFAVSGSASNTYNFSGAINNSGAAANFGPGTYNVAGGIISGGGSATAFGAGTFRVGPGTVKCSKVFYSICNLGASMTFGAGAFTLAGGIYNTGGATLSLGAGSTSNSFNIGAGSSGSAIETAGGSVTTLGGMASGTFQAVGGISTAGGSTFAMGAAPAHDLNGAFSLAGSATLGAGIYTIAGNVGLGTAGGGGTVSGAGVGIVTSGTFSVAAGYSNVTLTAPTSGTFQNLVVASSGTGGASFAEGASGTSLSGVFYVPNGPVSLSGAGNVGSGTGQCLTLVGTTITLAGGAALATACAGRGGGTGGGTVALVQ